MSDSELVAQLRAHIGSQGDPLRNRDPVNQAMIRHWCDAMADHNPVYTSPEFAAKSVHGEIVAPPTMLQAWTMTGFIPRTFDPSDPQANVMRDIEAHGYTSVVATNCEHVYHRYLKLGDDISGVLSLEDVSEEKKTGLGIGHFITTNTRYSTADGEVVGDMKFRILKFKPGTGRSAAPAGDGAGEPVQRPLRPEPGVIQETAFFWDGLEEGELRIQKCEACAALFHPPLVRCNQCGSYEFGYQVASGKAKLYSFVRPEYPQVPMFDYPYVVGLVELEEGTRLLTNVVDLDPEAVEVGMPLELVIRKENSAKPLPLFRPATPARNEKTLRFDEVEEGQVLGACPIPISTSLIVATALASRDYQDVHHDRQLAIERGSPDIFMNILTSGGLCGRYVSDWAGPEAMMKKLSIRLGAPNYPGDCMTMAGEVSGKRMTGGEGLVDVAVRGYNKLGDHVTGTIVLALPTNG